MTVRSKFEIGHTTKVLSQTLYCKNFQNIVRGQRLVKDFEWCIENLTEKLWQKLVFCSLPPPLVCLLLLDLHFFVPLKEDPLQSILRQSRRAQVWESEEILSQNNTAKRICQCIPPNCYVVQDDDSNAKRGWNKASVEANIHKTISYNLLGSDKITNWLE